MNKLYELPTKMSATKLLKKVKELQKEYPKAVYVKKSGSNSCQYFSGSVKNGPKTHGCIIGHAIRELYPENMSVIKRIEKDGDDLIVSYLLSPSKTTDKLGDIQQLQDNQISWGNCQ